MASETPDVVVVAHVVVNGGAESSNGKDEQLESEHSKKLEIAEDGKEDNDEDEGSKAETSTKKKKKKKNKSNTKDVEHEPELERELVAEEGAKGPKLVAEEELVAKEALITPTGPMTRSRVKLFNQAIGGMLNHIWDRPNDLSQVTTSLVLIHAQGPHQKRMAESDEEENSHNRNNKLLIKAMKKMMNTELETFRQEFHQNLRSPRRSQEKHEKVTYQKEAKPRRPQEKPNWRSRSTKDQANSYYYNRGDQRRVEKAIPQHNDVKEVKAVKQSQKESLVLAKEQFEDELLKILNAYNKPKKAKRGLPSNSEKAKLPLPSEFVKDMCDLFEKPDFLLENDQACDKLILSKPVQPSSTFCFSQGTGANYLGEVTSRKGTFKVQLHIHDNVRKAEGALNILAIKEKPPDLQQPQSICKKPKQGAMSGIGELTQAEAVLVHNQLSKAEYNSVIKEKPPDATPRIKTRGNYLKSQKRMKANLLSLGSDCTILRPTKKTNDREISTHHWNQSRDLREDCQDQFRPKYTKERIGKQSNLFVRASKVKKPVLSKHQLLLLNYKKALMSLTNPTPVLPSEIMSLLQDYEDMFSEDKPIGLPSIHDDSQSHIWRLGDYLGRSSPTPHEILVILLHMFHEEPKMDLSSLDSFHTYQWRPGEFLDTSSEEELVTNNALIQEEPPDPTPLSLIVMIPSTKHTANLIQVSNSFTRLVSHITRTVIMSLSNLGNIEKELDLFKEYLEPNSCLRTQVKHEHFKDNALIKAETCLLGYSDSMTVITHLLFAKAVDNISGTKEEPPDLEVLLSNLFERTGIGVVLMPRIDSPSNLTRRTIDNAYELELQGKCNVSPSFNVSDLVPYIADQTDLRSNPFQEGGDDMIMDSTKDVEHEPELERELVAEEGAKGPKLVAEEELVAKEALITPTGPMTRSRVKLFNQAIGGMLNHIWDRPNDLSQVTTSLVLIHAQGPHQSG
ncbi:hypothetical protein ISN44_As11g028600 [Arabidopsis suecica]|uniref:Uncharacterized protein n=1 Tax=Arabidopsis suecica TaxID=45249 RepID=A0A8T1ZE52_ARASU|nr:hypothetical protein ISN44_As11g028600 [Arabidopsis suecica]